MCPQEFKSGPRADPCTPMFTAALLTTAEIWKQPKCPLIDRPLDRGGVVYTDSGMLHSHRKRKPAICSNMDELEGIILSKISQTKTNTVWSISLVCGA